MSQKDESVFGMGELNTILEPAMKRLSINVIPQPNGAASQSRDTVFVEREPTQPTAPSAPPNHNQPSEQPSKNFDLQPLFKEASLELLEGGVEEGKAIIAKLQQALASNRQSAQGEIKVWYEQLEELKAKAAQQKTIIGVVGNTGAGKSSVINALLDEERLLPINGMRACTAAVTEISYNQETEDLYRASIEFIEFEDWENELRIFAAGIALAKIRAVFPRKTKDQILKSSPEVFLADPAVRSLLGSVKEFSETDPLRFYKKLQTYVDSKEKTGKRWGESRAPHQMELWPLIKVVKLYVKADVLSTGAIIVDLPGAHDANAARAGIADGYLKNCTGLWIVAPITRAVDDKTAKTLLGETFRRQLLMDGGFPNVTFICTQSDNISVSEAILSLNLEEDLQELNARLEKLEEKIEELKDMDAKLGRLKAKDDDVHDSLNEELETWLDLKGVAEEGRLVFKPKASKGDKKALQAVQPQKAEKSNKVTTRTVEKKNEVSDNKDQVGAEEWNSSDFDGLSNKNSRESPLTMEEINDKISDLHKSLKKINQDRREISARVVEVKETLSKAKTQHKKLQKQIATLCIQARNEYSTDAIKHDFAGGLWELDMEIAEARDPNNFDPSQNLRDYEAVANELPVFCVSSRGYQKLKGRLRRDGELAAFTDVKETGIPQLQQHCKKLTEKAREHGSRKFLDSLSLMINSLSLWTSQASSSGLELDNRMFELLEEVLNGVVSDTAKNLQNALEENLYTRFSQGVDAAAKQAIPTAQSWRGLQWQTYRAICRRDGVFTNHYGLHDFNAQLSDPLIKMIASRWEKMFSRVVPQIIDTYLVTCRYAFVKLHRQVQRKADRIVSLGQLGILQRQLLNYELEVKAAADEAVAFVTTMQRDLNREFVPAIRRVMLPAYESCSMEAGTGCFARMKAKMVDHVTKNQRTMFETATGQVRSKLEKMVKQVEGKMRKATMKIYETIRRDYMLLGDENYLESIGVRRNDVFEEIKKEVELVLGGVENAFREMMEKGQVKIEREYEGEGDDEEEVEEVSEAGSESDDEEKDSDYDRDDDDDDGDEEGDSYDDED
ncbi:hypothetical protein BDZ91DRAFT_712137 [Kalaharituber pfeilii]|nr:hypothetical protein BDZ91DRAFT_712137 [Kalaharituber pfeilii]